MTETATDESIDEMTDEPKQQDLFPGDGGSSEVDREDREALLNVEGGFLGFRCRKSMAPQSSQWPDEMKTNALDAIGGGDTDSASMSDKLFAKNIDSVKKMNEALTAVNRLCTDRYYTLPHPESGVRLVKKGQEETLRDKIEAAKTAIYNAAMGMNEDRENIKEVMAAKLKGRYAKHSQVYDLDFTKLYHVSFRFTNLEVPNYLRHSTGLYEEALAVARKDAAEVVRMEKEAMAKTLFDVIDHLVERLEARRLLDNKHEVTEVNRSGKNYIVTYLHATSKQEEIAELSEADFELRVADDTKRKVFTNATATKIFDEIDYAQHQLDQTGIGAGELQDVFGRLKTTIGGQSRKTLPKALRENGAYREGLANQLGRLGEAVLDLSVVKGKRDIIRRRASSRNLNPAKH